MELRLILYEDFPAQSFVRLRLQTPEGIRALSLRGFLGLECLSTAEKKFESALPFADPRERTRLSNTLRELNSALLESEEERDFFFSCLSPKKAALLKEHLPAYLDTTGDLCRALASLPTKIAELSDAAEVFLVPHGSTPSRFIEECARQFASHLPQSVQLSTWNEALLTGEAQKSRRPLIVEAASSSLFFRLSDRVKRATKRGDVAIAFFGNAADRQGLKLALARAGLELDENLNDDGKENAAVPTPWQKIRQARQVQWPRRLGIERQWRELTETESELKDSVGPPSQRLKDAALISEDEATALESDSAPLTSAAGQRVCLLPFQPYPPLTATTVLYFFNDAVSPAQAMQVGDRSLLSPWEKERLWDSGFPVSATAPLSLSALITQATSPTGRRALFFCLGKNAIAETRRAKLRPVKDATYWGNWADTTFKAPSVFSASQLSAFEACPANFLFSRRLKLQPQEKLWQKSALIYGAIAHSTLEKWILLPERTGQAAIALFNEQLAERFPTLLDNHPLRISLNETIRELANALPELENQMLGLFGVHGILGLEVPFRYDRLGASFTGRIDRVDRLSDGSLLVIDYKTGNVDFSPDHITDGRDHQVALYVWAAEKQFCAPVSGFLYYDLKKKELRRGLIKKDRLSAEGLKKITRGHAVDDSKWNELLQAGEAHLSGVLTEFGLGLWRPKPGPVCDGCSYLTLCRKGKLWQS